jgi:citrate synthase
MPTAKELLGELAPKNKEQEKIFNEAVDKLLKDVSQRKQEMASGVYKNTNGIYLANAKLKIHSDGFSKDREYRQIATIPMEVAERIKAKHGDEVMLPKNGEMLKKILRKDPEFAGCLTVDRKTI